MLKDAEFRAAVHVQMTVELEEPLIAGQGEDAGIGLDFCLTPRSPKSARTFNGLDRPHGDNRT